MINDKKKKKMYTLEWKSTSVGRYLSKLKINADYNRWLQSLILTSIFIIINLSNYIHLALSKETVMNVPVFVAGSDSLIWLAKQSRVRENPEWSWETVTLLTYSVSICVFHYIYEIAQTD